MTRRTTGAFALILIAACACLCLPIGSATAAMCDVTTTGVPPLNDLGSGLYLDQFEGGLYPNGSNSLPIAHEAEGLNRAFSVEPVNTSGLPDPNGRYVLLSIGMSNTSLEYCCGAWTFMGQAAVDPRVNHETLVLVNGARGGASATAWDSPSDDDYDRVRDDHLTPQGLSEAHVQVVWVKQANPGPSVSLPDPESDTLSLMGALGDIARAVKVRYPNCHIMFLSSRIYAGYASTALNPEPYAYESGFSVKWLIEAQINQMENGGVHPVGGDLNYDTIAPWLAWGPYLWADGLAPRSDGLIWECSDMASDGTHPSMSGQEKVGSMLLYFMLTSPFSKPWFWTAGDGDCDDDGDTDISDYAMFHTCLTGPTETWTGGCACVDFDADGDGDLADFAPFQQAFAVAPGTEPN